MPNHLPQPLDSSDPDVLELRALERLISARREQIRRFAQAASAGGPLSREGDLQLQVFLERNDMAERELGRVSTEPTEIRLARLESIAQALECSWDYFRRRARSDSVAVESSYDWAVCVR